MSPLVRCAVLATTVLACLSTSVGTAAADPHDDAVGLSPDGVRYADSLEGPLFDEDVTWVPGDRRTASWWVRNRAPEDAQLAVEVPPDAVVPGWLRVEARTGATWSPVGPDRLVLDDLLAGGEARRVDLRVGMRPISGDATMRRSADLRLRVHLTDVRGTAPGGLGPGAPGAPGAPGPSGAGTTSPSPSGLLPGTGAGFGPWLLVLAGGLLAAGAAVLRRREADS